MFPERPLGSHSVKMLAAKKQYGGSGATATKGLDFSAPPVTDRRLAKLR